MGRGWVIRSISFTSSFIYLVELYSRAEEKGAGPGRGGVKKKSNNKNNERREKRYKYDVFPCLLFFRDFDFDFCNMSQHNMHFADKVVDFEI